MNLPTKQRAVWLRFSVIAVAALVAAALFFLDPTEFRFFPRCPFKLLTGWDCPGCGFQRAAHAVLHGHWDEAWRYNPFLLYSIPYLLAVMLTEWVWRGERQDRWRRVVEGRRAVWLYLVLFCVWGVVRNL